MSGAVPPPRRRPARPRTTAASASSSSTSPSASRASSARSSSSRRPRSPRRSRSCSRAAAVGAAAGFFAFLGPILLMHAFAWLLNDLFFEGAVWIGFAIEALLFFVIAAIAGLRRLPGRCRRARRRCRRWRSRRASGSARRSSPGPRPTPRQGTEAVTNEPEIYRTGAGEPVARRAAPPPGPQLGRDPRRHRAPARGALALGRGTPHPGHRAHRLAPPGPRAPPRADHRRRRRRLRRRRAWPSAADSVGIRRHRSLACEARVAPCFLG